ncbi:DUF2829 domain-containing protein [Xenorhabdus sp. TH1]|uniref:DUF2829 domain-containing protein n=1 Tax=Xenorhabdus sp. TH1 TaxID=3130166 RepID=UPI0030D5F625
MSNVIKPECECPFDPKQYQCDCFIAPVGSFSWALIQLKLRKRIARFVWGDKGMYLAITPRVNNLIVDEGSAYAVDGVAVGTQYDYLTHIDLHNEHGNFVPWQPTQEDMMACDWELIKELDDMLVFDLKSEYEGESNYSGYLGVNKISDTSVNPMGILTITQNKTAIENTSIFHTNINKDYIHFAVSINENNSQKVKELFKKNLYVKVDDVIYNLGVFTKEFGPDITNSTYGVLYYYNHDDDPQKPDVQKLGEILKQTDQTKRYYLNWRDE